MSLINSLSRLARSPQGRRLAQRAMSYARSPEGRRKIEQARQQIAAKRKPRGRY